MNMSDNVSEAGLLTDSQPGRPTEQADVRLLLVGRTGHGKSSTGNSILREEVFRVSSSSVAETQTCQWSERQHVFGRVVEVVDTPGFFDTERDEITVQKEMLKALVYTTPGFHAIGYVLKLGERYTNELKQTQELFFNWFGADVEKFTFIIVTYCETEQMRNEYLFKNPQQKLKELIQSCGDRATEIDNKRPEETSEKQVKKIFDMVDEIKMRNGNYFTNFAYQLTVSYIQNKYPKKLTSDTIHLLEEAGLGSLCEEQIEYYERMCDGRREDGLNGPEASESSSDSDSDAVNVGQSGNLTIFYTETEEQRPQAERQRAMHNSRDRNQQQIDRNAGHNAKSTQATNSSSLESDSVRKIEMERVSYFERSIDSNESRYQEEETSNSSAVSPSLFAEVGGRRNTVSVGGRPSRPAQNQKQRTRQNRKVDMASVKYEPIDAFKGEPTDTRHSSRDGNPEQSTRRNRTVDMASVQYERINAFKEELRTDDSILTGLIEYMKLSWRYCKRKVRQCTAKCVIL